MKKLLSLIGLALGLALFTPSATAQGAFNGPKLTALTKPNPARPVFVAWASFTDLGNDQLEIDFEIDGQGCWSCYEVLPYNQVVCLFPLTRIVGQPLLGSVVVQKSTFVDAFWNLGNIHGLPPIFPPYK